MKLTFLGGASEVGSTALLLETKDSKSVFDYGLTPEEPPQYPLAAPPVDNIFLSHAHLDHSGMIPVLTRDNPVPFFTSQMTLLLSQILLRDNIKIAEYEGYPTMYSKGDVQSMDRDLHLVAEDSKVNLKNCDVSVHSAGHIPGALMYELEFNNGRRLLFTGDVNTINTRLVAGTASKKCDILVLESTYSGKDHELRQKIEYTFQDKIREVIDRNGKVIIPAFAVGRTQEVLLVLADLDLEIWLDGLGKEVTKLFLKESGFISNEKKLKSIYEKAHKVRSKSHRKKALGGDVILTTSGMLDGGPVLNYIKELNDNPKNAILLTGYQVEGSNGRLLLDKGQIKIHGISEKVNMEVEHFDFSAHAGHKELMNFAKHCDPEQIVLFHSNRREQLKQDLLEMNNDFEIFLPVEGKTIDL
jgi:putative mRNA 3-end processing factor